MKNTLSTEEDNMLQGETRAQEPRENLVKQNLQDEVICRMDEISRMNLEAEKERWEAEKKVRDVRKKQQKKEQTARRRARALEKTAKNFIYFCQESLKLKKEDLGEFVISGNEKFATFMNVVNKRAKRQTMRDKLFSFGVLPLIPVMGWVGLTLTLPFVHVKPGPGRGWNYTFHLRRLRKLYGRVSPNAALQKAIQKELKTRR